MTQENSHFNHTLYHHVSSSLEHSQCQLIVDYFYHALSIDSSALTKTHYFHGRYENIYLTAPQFKPINHLLNDAKHQAAILLNCKSDDLSIDFWFNDMPPNHITDWHKHDVMDEQLSAVFYLLIPKASGDLLIKNNKAIERIHPKENDFVFFNPDIEHSVEKNKSSLSRLSIGMNFGFLSDKEDN